jgi:hypothetical protein
MELHRSVVKSYTIVVKIPVADKNRFILVALPFSY